MILGDTCTRACGFCAVKTGRPTWFDDDEPRRVAEAIGQLGLEHVVVTSVARDDLPDGGSGIFAETIRRMRETIAGHGDRGPHPGLRWVGRAAADGHGRPPRHPQPQPRDREAPPEAGPQAGPLGSQPVRPAPGQGDVRRDRLRGPHEIEPDGRARRDARRSSRRRSRRSARSMSTSSRSASTCGRRSSTSRSSATTTPTSSRR